MNKIYKISLITIWYFQDKIKVRKHLMGNQTETHN